MTRHFSAVRLPLRSKFAAKLPRIPHLSKPRRREASAGVKNGLKSPACKFLIPCLAVSLMVLRPATCHAAVAALPWDQTLLALQNLMVGTVAPAAIGFAFAGAVALYALGGHDEQAGRLFGSGLGGLVALAIVHFLNYVAL